MGQKDATRAPRGDGNSQEADLLLGFFWMQPAPLAGTATSLRMPRCLFRFRDATRTPRGDSN